MSEETVKTDHETTPEGDTTTQQSSGNEAVQEAKKYRNRAQAAEAELAKIKADAEKARQAELEKQGEYKTLLQEREAELEALRKRDAEYSAEQKARRKLLLEKLPADDQELVEEMSLAKLEKYVSRQSTDVGNTPPPRGSKQRTGGDDWPGWAKATKAQRQAHLDAQKR